MRITHSTCTNLYPLLYLMLFFQCSANPRVLHSFPTRRSSDLSSSPRRAPHRGLRTARPRPRAGSRHDDRRSEEHTSELQSRGHLVCRLLLEKKKVKILIKLKTQVKQTKKR